jgi:translation initiation factor 1
MAQNKSKTVLFLCTGNYYRSRFAEILFNSVAARMGLPWRASSKGLALERGGNNIGPMAISAIKTLEVMGIQTGEAATRLPAPAAVGDFQAADRIVALKQSEHLPLVQERFSAWAERIEYWHVDDAPEALAVIEREVMGLVARILGGGTQQDTPAPALVDQKIDAPAKKPMTAKVGRETKGRRGKGVTTVSEVPLDEAGLLDLAAKLKQKCGTGGTVKDGRIEIQGDQRDRLITVLEAMGYRVKRVGG